MGSMGVCEIEDVIMFVTAGRRSGRGEVRFAE